MARQLQVLPNGTQIHMRPGGSTTTIRDPQPTNPAAAAALYDAPAKMAAAYGSPFNAFAPSAANMFNSYADMMKGGTGSLAQMFGAYANAYKGYGDTIGNIAGNAGLAAANDNAGRYASWAQGNTGFQNMLGALGAGALGAYGSTANAALQAQAVRESAAMKMMSDSLAANQAAVSSYGGQQAAAQAALAKAYADAGIGMAVGRGNVATAASNLGGAGSAALANLASGVSKSAADASAGNAQGQAALRGAIANSLSGVGAAELNALANNAASANTALAGLGTAASNAQGALGAANAGLGTGLGNNMASVSGNSMNFTRDMAKLDLARLLGVGQLNVSSQIGSNLGGLGIGPVGGGDISISGPNGVIGSGSYGGMLGGASGGISSGQAPIYMQPTSAWYSSPQYYDGGGMAGLNSLSDRGFGALSSLAGDSRNTFGTGTDRVSANQSNTLASILSSAGSNRGAISSQGDAGAADIRAGMDTAMGQIQDQGVGGRAAILAALGAGNDQISSQGRGIDSDSEKMFGGLAKASDTIGGRSILDSLNNNYSSSMADMRRMYEAGRKDPQELLREVYSGVQTLSNPFLQAGKDAYGTWMGNFPPPLQQTPGSFLDPMPYLAALQSGWAPFQSGLDRAFTQQNANVLGVLTSGQNTYNNSMQNLNTQFGNVMTGVGNALNPNSNNQQRDPQKALADAAKLWDTWKNMRWEDRPPWLNSNTLAGLAR